MEGQNLEQNITRTETVAEKLKRATEKVVGYFKEKFEGVLDRIIGDPYFVSPSERF